MNTSFSDQIALAKAMVRDYLPAIRRTWWILVLLVIYAFIESIEPYFYKLVVDALAARNFGMHGVLGVVLAWGACLLVGLGIGFVHDYVRNTTQAREWQHVILRSARSFFMLPYSYHISVDNAERMKFFHRGTEAAFWSVLRFLRDDLLQLLLFVGNLALCFWVNWQITLILVSMLPILACVSFFLSRRAHSLQKEANDLWDRQYGRMGDGFINLLVVKLFARTDHELDINRGHIEAALDAQTRIESYWTLLKAGSKFLNYLITLCAIALVAYFYARGSVTLGEVVLFLTASMRINGPLMALEQSYRQFVRSAADYAKLHKALELPPETDNGTCDFS